MARVRRPRAAPTPAPSKAQPAVQAEDVPRIALSARRSAAPSGAESRSVAPGDLPRSLVDGLRPRQVRFALHRADGATIAEAARLAGYGSSHAHLGRLARHPRIVALVAHRQREVAAATRVTAEAVVLRLWRLMTGRKASDSAKVKAAEILLRHLGAAHRVAPAALAAAEVQLDDGGLREADVLAISRLVGIPVEVLEAGEAA